MRFCSTQMAAQAEPGRQQPGDMLHQGPQAPQPTVWVWHVAVAHRTARHGSFEAPGGKVTEHT